MFKLIKYELMGRQKLIFGGLAVIALINLIIIAGFNFWWQGGMEAAFVISLAIGILGIFIVSIDSVNIVRRDLYNDTGYLVFTLPQSGHSILGAKLIVGILEIVMFTVFQVLISSIFIVPQIKNEFWDILNALINAFPDIIVILGSIFWGVITLLIMITFSIVLAKSILNTKRFGNLASFGVFILVSIVLSMLQTQLRRIPWTIKLNFGSISGGGFNLEVANAVLNVPEIAFTVMLPIILFILSGYLIHNKLEMR